MAARRRPLIARSRRRGSARRDIIVFLCQRCESMKTCENDLASIFFPKMSKVFLVTGANRGLGLEIAAGLVNDHSIDVILACRKRDACDAAVAEINNRRQRISSTSKPSTSTSTSPSFPPPPPSARARAALLPLDLSSPRSVFEFVEAMKKEGKGEKLDGIVLNAGISPSPPPPSDVTSPSSSSSSSSSSPLLPLPLPFPEGWSPDSVDAALATNHVGHFALIRGLLENGDIKKGARVLAVSSRASGAGKFEKGGGGGEGGGAGGDCEETLAALAPRLPSPFASYSRSKLANVLFCRELARRSGPGPPSGGRARRRGQRGEGEEEREDDDDAGGGGAGGGEEQGGDEAAPCLWVAATSPGLVRTPLARGFALSAAASAVPSWVPLRAAAVSALSAVAAGVAASLGQSAASGAASSLFAATAAEGDVFPDPSSSAGLPPRFAFVHGRKRADWLLSAQARDDELARRLWEATEAVVAEAKRVWERERGR